MTQSNYLDPVAIVISEENIDSIFNRIKDQAAMILEEQEVIGSCCIDRLMQTIFSDNNDKLKHNLLLELIQFCDKPENKNIKQAIHQRILDQFPLADIFNISQSPYSRFRKFGFSLLKGEKVKLLPEVRDFIKNEWNKIENKTENYRLKFDEQIDLIYRLLDDPNLEIEWHQKLWQVIKQNILTWSERLITNEYEDFLEGFTWWCGGQRDQVLVAVQKRLADSSQPPQKKWIYLAGLCSYINKYDIDSINNTTLFSYFSKKQREKRRRLKEVNNVILDYIHSQDCDDFVKTVGKEILEMIRHNKIARHKTNQELLDLLRQGEIISDDLFKEMVQYPNTQVILESLTLNDWIWLKKLTNNSSQIAFYFAIANFDIAKKCNLLDLGIKSEIKLILENLWKTDNLVYRIRWQVMLRMLDHQDLAEKYQQEFYEFTFGEGSWKDQATFQKFLNKYVDMRSGG